MNLWTHAEWWGGPSRDRVTLGEGGTPLVRSVCLGRELGLGDLWFKCEGANPTGSYKDRFAAAAVSRLKASGRKACLATSSGNTGAALAAYCAIAKIPCHLAIVEGAPEGKLRQMQAYGARLLRIRGFGASPSVNAEVINGLRALADELGAGLEISAFAHSPLGMDGVQSMSFEIAERLGGTGNIDVFSPAGGGGLALAVARGFSTAAARGAWTGRARIHCVQPEGNDTIATPLRDGAARARAVESRTAISGLQVASVIDGDATLKSCRASGGTGHVVSDERVWHWQSRLARDEGIFAEPAGAVALAGVEAALARHDLAPGACAVCLVTGSGFKDERSLPGSPVPLVNDFAEFAAAVRRS